VSEEWTMYGRETVKNDMKEADIDGVIVLVGRQRDRDKKEKRQRETKGKTKRKRHKEIQSGTRERKKRD